MHYLICFLKQSHGLKTVEISYISLNTEFYIFKLWKLHKGLIFPLKIMWFYNLTEGINGY